MLHGIMPRSLVSDSSGCRCCIHSIVSSSLVLLWTLHRTGTVRQSGWPRCQEGHGSQPPTSKDSISCVEGECLPQTLTSIVAEHHREGRSWNLPFTGPKRRGRWRVLQEVENKSPNHEGGQWQCRTWHCTHSEMQWHNHKRWRSQVDLAPVWSHLCPNSSKVVHDH